MFKLIKKRISLIKQFYPMLHKAKKHYFILSLCAILGTVITYINPEFYKIFINDVIIGKEIKYILIVLGGYLLLYLLETGLGYIQFIVRNKFSNVTFFFNKMQNVK